MEELKCDRAETVSTDLEPLAAATSILLASVVAAVSAMSGNGIGLFSSQTQPGSIASLIRMGVANANSLREAISPEAWAVLSELESRFEPQTHPTPDQRY